MGMEQINGSCTTLMSTLLKSCPGGTLALASQAGFPAPPLLDRINYPDVTYWESEDWRKHGTKGVTQLRGKVDRSTAAKCAFIQKADGAELSEEEWKTMHNMARAIFNGLSAAPESWLAHSTTEQRTTVYNELMFKFPFLSFCNGYWKAEKYVINQFPLWKNARKETIKMEEDNPRKRKADKDSNDHSVHEHGETKKVASELHGSKKVVSVPAVQTLVSNPLLGMAVPKIITTVSRRPITVTEVGTDQESQETAQNEIAGPTPSTPDTVPTATTIAMTTATTSEAAIIQAAAESAPIVLPTAEVTQANLLSTTVAHSTSKLFQPGPKPTGRNLYGRTWKDLNPNGTTAEFTKAWQNLPKVEKRVYDRDAKASAKGNVPFTKAGIGLRQRLYAIIYDNSDFPLGLKRD
ncbi:hypothetical protein PHLCEN_2v4773 [Hermanssonia centrifuga]|uniref:Uncharacterized protein n=1 Tax=Hermanssonia centrifuga TaxID=98765 RepID=A0A2R6PJ67_9APHY|nr:hypothetical protein PHLCEN_2v4773 [Hermanssonia centrifuga]